MNDYTLDNIMARCESRWLEAPEYDDEEEERKDDDELNDDI